MNYVDVPQQRRPADNSVYEDVMSHCGRCNKGDGRYTDAHETAHFISSEIRNAHSGHNNGYYILGGKGVVVDHPAITIGDIAGYVPASLRGFRYQLYLVDQRRYWDNEPLYILEELNCYVTGGAVAVDDARNGRQLERTDAVSGAFEFSIYCTAMAMAVKDKDRRYHDGNEQYREFLSLTFARASAVFEAGKDQPEFQSQLMSKLVDAYNGSEDGRKFEQFKREFQPRPPEPQLIDWSLGLSVGIAALALA